MSGSLVNLRQARKRKARAEREARAEQNRTEYGRTRAERDLTAALSRQETRKHEAGRIERAATKDENGETEGGPKR